MSSTDHRLEHDLLGDRAVPSSAYYGVHTLRAVENFPITGTSIAIYPDLIRALASIKEAAALANNELGLLDKARTDAIVKACEELRGGRLHDQFVVDVIQGGAGTSTNMNANEVIANRALEIMGHRARRVSAPASERTCQHESEHERRVSDRAQSSDLFRDLPSRGRDGGVAPRLRGQGRRIQGRAENGPHPAAGCGADDPWAGIQHVCGNARRG